MQYTIPLTAEGIPQVKWGEYSLENMPPICSADNQALLCGEISGIIGLDIDSDVEEARIMALLGVESSAYLAKRGSKGRTIFFKYSGEVSRSWKRDGKVVAELLSNKRLTTIPPSIHRTTGKRYVWINEGAPLVNLPDRLDEMLDFLYPAPARVTPAYTTTAYDNDDCDNDVSMEEVEQMLAHISADCSREDWLSIGMGLRDEFGDAAYGAWDSWSSGSAKYKQREMHNIWRSFNGSGVSIGSVVYHAQQSGYIKKYEAVECDWDIDLSYLDVKTRKALSAHGLVGEIAEWITETATRPQPQLALGAALTLVGMLKGHKYCTVTGLRTNFLAMNIAPSGSGKDDPLKAIDMIAAATNLDKHLLSEPTAGTSLLKGLLDADRVGLWAIDEFGRYLAHVTSKNAGNYQKEIIDYIIKMFGRAGGIIRGKKFANEKLNPQINIVNPHLCVIGASVKEHIVDNCTSKSAIDGFLNRWVLFESTERPRMKIGKKRVEVPKHIIDQIQKIIDEDPNGQYPLLETDSPIIKEVRYTPEAYAMIQQYQEDVEDLIDKSTPLLQALYTRTYEHTTKIALILCDNEFIRNEDVNVAIEIVTESNKLIADLAGLIADNEQEKMVIRLLNVVRTHKGISHSDLIRRTKYLNAKSRKEMLNDLVQSGEVIATEAGKSYTYS